MIAFVLSLILNCSTLVKKNEKPSSLKSTSSMPPDSSIIEEPPALIEGANPEYPALAEQTGTTGTVWVKILVNSEGKVEDAVVLQDSGTNVGFEEAALEAALRTRWKPATANGIPISSWITFKIDFSLE
jgi:protein TonB